MGQIWKDNGTLNQRLDEFIPLEYLYDSTTTAPASGGEIRLNNANVLLVTEVFISIFDFNILDIDSVIGGISTGQRLVLKNIDIASESVIYEVTGMPTLASNTYTVPVALEDAVAGFTTMADQSHLGLSIVGSASGSSTLGGLTFEVNAQTGTSYTLVDADHGKLVTLDNAAAIALNVDTGLRSDFACSIMQKGAGQVTIGGTATVNNADGFTVTEKQYVKGTIQHLGSDVFVSDGRLVA